MKFLANVDLVKNQLMNAVIHNSASAPSTPASGQVWYDTTNFRLKVYSGLAWIDVTDQVPLSTITADKVFVGTGNGTGSYVGTLTNGGVSGVLLRTDVISPSNGNVLTYQANGYVGQTSLAALGAGTVTSVDASGTNGIVITGTHPVTGAGTLGISISGNVTGLTSLTSASISGTGVSAAMHYGPLTGLASLATSADEALHTTNALTFVTTTGDAATTTFNGSTARSIGYGSVGAAPLGHAHAGSGSVTSITVTGGNGVSIVGSPITTSGTIGVNLGAITPTSVNGVTVSAGTNAISLNVGTTTLIANQSGTLGTAAFQNTTAFATAAQGIKADNAIPMPVGTAANQVLYGSGSSAVSAMAIGTSAVIGRLSAVNSGNLASLTVDTDISAVTTHTSLPTSLAIKNYVGNIAASGIVYKGTLAGSAALPAASAGWMYMYSSSSSATATNGPAVVAGDIVICVLSSSGGTWTAEGAKFDIIQKNIDDATLPRRYSAPCLVGSTNTYAHGLGTAPGKTTADLLVSVYFVSGSTYGALNAGEQVFPDIKVDTTNITVTFSQSVAAGEFLIVANG